MPQEDRQDVEWQFLEQIKRAAEADSWLRNHPPVVEFKKTGGQGAEISSNHPIVCTVKDAFQTITGTSPTISGRTGGADTRYLIKHGQTPTVIFGPGMTSEMHAIDESVPIGNLLVAVQTLALTIAEWSGVDGGTSQ
jgi:acetylornithine deacetylase